MNDELQLKNEDQLLKLINNLYKTDESYSILYETILFENVSTETVCEFINIYDIEKMTYNTWHRLSKRLSKETKNAENKNNNDNDKKRYKDTNKKKQMKGISFSKENEYDGIINHLRKKSNNQIENEINITASSLRINEGYQPLNVTLFDDNQKHFRSKNESNSWLCFDFKEHRIIPTDYSIRSCPFETNSQHPRSWVIECSNDNKSWETVDEEKDCSYLNGKNYSHTFTMNNQKSTEYRYFRMRPTGLNWNNYYYFDLCSFEIYGQFI